MGKEKKKTESSLLVWALGKREEKEIGTVKREGKCHENKKNTKQGKKKKKERTM